MADYDLIDEFFYNLTNEDFRAKYASFFLIHSFVTEKVKKKKPVFCHYIYDMFLLCKGGQLWPGHIKFSVR